MLPESSVKELNEAKVLAVGPGGLDKEGKRVAPSVAPGDKVLIPQVGLDLSLERSFECSQHTATSNDLFSSTEVAR